MSPSQTTLEISVYSFWDWLTSDAHSSFCNLINFTSPFTTGPEFSIATTPYFFLSPAFAWQIALKPLENILYGVRSPKLQQNLNPQHHTSALETYSPYLLHSCGTLAYLLVGQEFAH